MASIDKDQSTLLAEINADTLKQRLRIADDMVVPTQRKYIKEFILECRDFYAGGNKGCTRSLEASLNKHWDSYDPILRKEAREACLILQPPQLPSTLEEAIERTNDMRTISESVGTDKATKRRVFTSG